MVQKINLIKKQYGGVYEMVNCECGAKLFCCICGKKHLCLRWCDNYNNNLRCDVICVKTATEGKS